MKKADRLFKKIQESMPAPYREPDVPPVGEAPYAGLEYEHRFARVPVERLLADAQVRADFDEAELDELAQSIRQFGQLSPIRVLWDASRRRWKVLTGERRLRACRRAGLDTVRCELLEREATAGEVLAEQLVENLLRSNLRPAEEAQGFRGLQELHGWNPSEVARHLGISQAKVAKALAYFDLAPEVQEKVQSGTIGREAAFSLSRLDEQQQKAVAAKGRLTKADAREEVRRRKAPPSRGRPPAALEIYRAANGVKVRIEAKRRHTAADRIEALEEVMGRLQADREAA
jgi:ParB family chromosome partitioning protein